MGFAGPLAAYSISIIVGHLFLRNFFRENEAGRAIVFLAPGVGAGISASVLFVSLIFFGRLSLAFCILMHAGLILAAIVFSEQHEKGEHTGIAGVAVVLVLASALFFAILAKSPCGTGLDVWAIWKLKARFIFYGAWTDIFSPKLGYSHADYPIFYPLMLCWGWLLAGRETAVAGWTLSWMFFVSIVGLVMTALPRKTKAPVAAALLLVATPHFTGMGASQYADIFIAYYGFAASWLLCLAFEKDDMFYCLASGIFFGIGALIKNEGLLFLAAGFTVCVGIGFFKKPRSWRLPGVWALGVAFLLAALGWLKAHASEPGYLLRPENFQHNAAHFVQRGAVVWRFFAKEIFKENSWVYAWFFVFFSLIFFRRKWVQSHLSPMFAVFFIVNLGYFCVYLITPINLASHLSNSLDRLLIHTFPMAIYLAAHVSLVQNPDS